MKPKVKYKILQLMSFSIDQNTIERKSIPSHNLFGFDSLVKAGHTVEWVSPESHLSKFEKSVCKILGTNFSKLYLQFKCVFIARKFDIIYSGHDMHLILLGLLRLLKICRKPVFVLCHFSYNLTYVNSRKSRWFKFIERKIVFAGVDKLVFANERLFKLAGENFAVPAKHSNWVNWGPDIEFFDENHTATEVFKNLENGTEPYFAAAGTANRDYSTLVTAFKELPMHNLKIFGRVGEAIASNGCGHIKFYKLKEYGDLSMRLLSVYYANATAVLIPILHENDVPNGATVLIEALAAGKPVIITDFATNYIDVEEEGVGLKVKAGNSTAWINAIQYLNNNPQAVKKMSSNARKLAKEKYNYSQFSKNLMREIESCVCPVKKKD